MNPVEMTEPAVIEDPDIEYRVASDAPVFNPPKPKKGRASWAYDDPLSLPDEWKDPNLTYRWVRNENRDIRRRQSQGFVLANGAEGVGKAPKGNHIEGASSAGGDLVLMAAYKEVRDEYIEHNNKQVDAIERAITRTNEENAPVDERTGQRAQVRQRLVIN